MFKNLLSQLGLDREAHDSGQAMGTSPTHRPSGGDIAGVAPTARPSLFSYLIADKHASGFGSASTARQVR
jgi:hypothetical protein